MSSKAWMTFCPSEVTFWERGKLIHRGDPSSAGASMRIARRGCKEMVESFVKDAFIARLAFPDDKNAKTKEFEMANSFAISILVALKLRRPVRRIGLRL